MGVDLIAGGRSKRAQRKETKSTNEYRRMLVDLYAFMGRRIDSKFNAVVSRRLMKSNTTLRQMSLSALSHHMEGQDGKIAVVVGPVVNDERLPVVPKMTVCALRFTKTAKARIEAAGGECLSFDQLALKAPTGANTVLLRGKATHREAVKHFGNVHTGAKPRVKKGSRERRGRYLE